MNLGIYLQTIQLTESLEYSVKNINEGIENGSLRDASIFYDSIGPNPLRVKCGCFNSTDLWSFTGDLIVTATDTAKTARNIVNKFNMYFYYGWDTTKDTMGLIDIVTDERIKSICRNEEESKELYRLTGKKCVGIVNNFNLAEILEVVK